MSKWIEIKIEDVHVDEDDLNLLAYSDEHGNIYYTVNLADLKRLLKEKP